MWMLAAVLACGDADPSDSDTPAHACDALVEPGPAECDGAYEVDWDSWGEGFMLTQCQTCHASSASNRYGAPEANVFDTVEDVCSQRERIQVRVLDEETMPPAGGLTEDDKVLLQTWLDCVLPYEEPATTR